MLIIILNKLKIIEEKSNTKSTKTNKVYARNNIFKNS